MDETEFEELIKRCLAGQATKEESSLVEKWLDQRRNKDPFSSLSMDEKEGIRFKIFKELSSKMMERGGLTKVKSGVGKIAFYRAAAAIILISVLTYTLLEFTGNLVEEKITVIHSMSSSNGSKKVILSDSSIVWLKGNSSIHYPEKFDDKERKVSLIGEALFEVSRDPNYPFIIQCGGLTAKVLGTSFNIKSSETDVEVLVLTGKVKLSSKGNSEGLIVHSNEKAVYNTAQNKMEKVITQEDEKVAKTTGTEYSMLFNATRMAEIIRRIEGKFNVRVLLSDELLNSCTITADFTDQSLDRTLSMISQTLGIEYEIRNGQVTLKGVGCDENTME